MLNQVKNSWYENTLIAFCLFTLIISIYSVLNLSGFMVADFFKNKIINEILFSHDMFTNLFSSNVGLFILAFFIIKIILTISILKVKDNFTKMSSMIGLFLINAIEGVCRVGGDCYNDDGSLFACGFNHIVNPFASFIIITIFLFIIFKQISIVLKEQKITTNK